MPQRERWLLGVIIFAFLALITFPILIANAAPDGDHVFSGFLLNPVDGHSYLAKMRQGYEGSWLFALPYTVDPGEGTAINLYYIFLGHAARTFGLSLMATFHAARALGALALALVTYFFFRKVIIDERTRWLAFALALFGSGLGWLAIWFGFFSSDFWVAEAYPFLASYTNAHFPLGLALQVWLLSFALAAPRPRLGITILAAAALSVIYPFGWIVVVGVCSGTLLWLALMKEEGNQHWPGLLAVAVGGAPYSLYALWVVNTHPVLSEWNAQNLTQAPGLLDLLISLSPAIVLAIWGLASAFRSPRPADRFLATWLIVGLLLVFAPFGLQRRLISGLYIPVVGLAALALGELKLAFTTRRLAAFTLFALALPTNALLILGTVNAARENDPLLTLSREEVGAFSWLGEHAPRNSLVLAATQSGLLLPAYAPLRVLSGHPFETVHADARLAEVTAFYSGALDRPAELDYLKEWGVDYVLYGPRERKLGSLPELPGWQLVYDQGDLIQIWAHPQNQ